MEIVVNNVAPINLKPAEGSAPGLGEVQQFALGTRHTTVCNTKIW